MSKSHKRRLSRTEVRTRRRFVAGLILFILAVAVAIYLGAASHIPQVEPVPLSAGMTSPDVDALPAIALTASDREIYPYSVIEGGAWTVEEFKNAMARDPVVAAHYAGFAVERTHVERLTQPRLAHVSYRIGNSIFWTRKPIALKPGETVLTDGVHVARTRCGNQVAQTPGEVSPLEPAPETMDVPLKTGSASPLFSLLRAPTELPSGLGGSISPAAGMSAPLATGSPIGPGIGGPLTSGFLSAPASPAGQNSGTWADRPVDDPLVLPPGAPSHSPSPGTSHSPNGPPLPPIGAGFPPIGLVPPGMPDMPLPSDGSPVVSVDAPDDPPHDPVSVPEPGTMFLLAGSAAYALRRVRAARR
jgi:hypothetical protein